ncbi:MAG: type II toxin-antitoxin system death-on-curing family toxin [Saprospiraceae bacterium]|jgi:death-on-curing protein|uniref:type II toxin-antitoxin system death-on-curing family toxin n=1 Tax=Sediminibacterium sp. TaxID=1917865 RepID=UPI001ED1D75E|nr:type II toxin-antitoxin system death-on-curing family toxin [Sediminibacterium sp.]MBK8356500.1 type II toxin-antitoxin system death-on-curing family toxin [Candidatus Brachybacter algidus]MDI9312383.1 type II toxin-antitoxin system death-on-curing family toxin [Limnohabitans sp.]
MQFNYFTSTYAIQVHDDIINNSGGSLGILNIGLLESTLEHLQNDLYYPEIENKVTHLFYAINKNHSFQDGNKRASIALSAYFLEINNLSFRVNRFIEEMENIAVDVADNRIDKDLLFEIVCSLTYENDFSEELKIKIINAKGLI